MYELKKLKSADQFNSDVINARLNHNDLEDYTLFETPAIKTDCLFTDINKLVVNNDDYKTVINPDTNRTFGIVKKDFKLVNHLDVFPSITKKMISLFGSNIEIIDTSYNYGAYASRQFIFNDITHDLNKANTNLKVDDIVKMSLTIFNGLGGNASLGGIGHAFRLACLNGQVSLKNMFKLIFRHTKNLDVSVFNHASGRIAECFHQQVKEFNIMRDISINYNDVRFILESTIAKVKEIKDQSKERSNPKMDTILSQFDKEKIKLGSTLYAFYNALTHYSTHVDTSKGSILSSENARTKDVLMVLNNPVFKPVYAS